MPISVATELISTEKCFDMDCVLDLWLNTIYDEQAKGCYKRTPDGWPVLFEMR